MALREARRQYCVHNDDVMQKRDAAEAQQGFGVKRVGRTPRYMALPEGVNEVAAKKTRYRRQRGGFIIGPAAWAVAAPVIAVAKSAAWWAAVTAGLNLLQKTIQKTIMFFVGKPDAWEWKDWLKYNLNQVFTWEYLVEDTVVSLVETYVRETMHEKRIQLLAGPRGQPVDIDRLIHQAVQEVHQEAMRKAAAVAQQPQRQEGLRVQPGSAFA